ncbi:MAG: ABC transporter ATP-binding protein [Clostridia bacterium]|nr:ABC transporter ATP-binding protein [Clostridia bacterium]
MILKAEQVSKRYFRKTGEANHFFAVKGASLELKPGAVTVLMGRSGSGKTTLLHMLSGLLKPTEGKILLDGTDIYSLDDEGLSKLRNEKIGVVPQGKSALETLTVMENILLPVSLYGKASNVQAAEGWLEKLGIASLRDAMPGELSGGELRRMAIARALIGSPDVVLADEPTGDLDDENTKLVLSVLREAADMGAAVLIVTHENEALSYADQAYRMQNWLLEPYAEKQS